MKPSFTTLLLFAASPMGFQFALPPHGCLAIPPLEFYFYVGVGIFFVFGSGGTSRHLNLGQAVLS